MQTEFLLCYSSQSRFSLLRRAVVLIESSFQLSASTSRSTARYVSIRLYGQHNLGLIDHPSQPSRDFRTIDWETLPKTVAFHAPYVLLFSWNFIEVRHIHTGKLVQILQGSDVRCVWDGSGIQPDGLTNAPPRGGYGDEAETIEPRIHVVMDDPPQGPRGRGTPQTVSELQPTVLLSVRS